MIKLNKEQFQAVISHIIKNFDRDAKAKNITHDLIYNTDNHEICDFQRAMNIRQENSHPDFNDVDLFIHLLKHLEPFKYQDASYQNDEYPSMTNGKYHIWLCEKTDYKFSVMELSEHGESIDETAITFDDVNKMLKHIGHDSPSFTHPTNTISINQFRASRRFIDDRQTLIDMELLDPKVDNSGSKGHIVYLDHISFDVTTDNKVISVSGEQADMKNLEALERDTYNQLEDFGYDLKKPNDWIPELKGNTKEDVRKWCLAMNHKGLDFHWDDNPEDVVYLSGEVYQLFTIDEAKKVQDILNDIHKIDCDIFIYTFEAMNSQNNQLEKLGLIEKVEQIQPSNATEKPVGKMLSCKCGNTKRFTVSAREHHTWEVDNNGDFIKDIECGDTDKSNDYSCLECGEFVEAKGGN